MEAGVDARSTQTSTEIIAAAAGSGASVEVLSARDQCSISSHTTHGGPPKVVMRTKRRNSERPWSVSCLSQLKQTETAQQRAQLEQEAANQGLANHSISESALHMWSSSAAPGPGQESSGPVTPSTSTSAAASARTGQSSTATMLHTNAASMTTMNSSMRSVESKGSLKRRKNRSRKKLMVSRMID